MAKPTGMPNGRPLKWKTPEELGADVDKYIEFVKDNPTKLANKAGFALFCDVDKDTIFNYEKRDGFFGPIKKMMQFSEEQCVEKCFSSNTQIAGTVFLMKNLHKYTDKQEIQTTGTNEVTIKGDLVNKLRINDDALDAVQKLLDENNK